MKIFPEQLASALTQSIQSIYLLFGNELLLKQEAREQIIIAVKDHGFDEVKHFTVDNQLDWNSVFDAFNEMSLFSTKQVIHLLLPETGLTTAQSNQLKTVAPLVSEDYILILEGGRLTQKQEAAQWFKLFNKNAEYVVCNTPDIRQLPKFIANRCQSLDLRPDTSSIQLLAQWHEGNLFALAQSLLKLQLLYPDGRLTIERLEHALSKQAHFTPFQLIDALIENNAQRAMQILQELEQEDVEIILLVRLLQKELVQLYKMQELQYAGNSLQHIFDQFYIWQNRRVPLANTLRRLSLTELNSLIKQLSSIEIAIKTEFETNSWILFTNFCLSICGLLPDMRRI